MNFLSLIIVKQNNDNTISSLYALVSQMIIENRLSNQPMYLKCNSIRLFWFLFYFNSPIKTNLKTDRN